MDYKGNRTTLSHFAAERPAVIVTGSRQAGKTSLLRRVFPDYGYVSLDLPLLAEEAEESGEQCLDKHAPPLMVNEVQYAPRLFRYLKASMDDKAGAKRLVSLDRFPKVLADAGRGRESIAGRATILDIYPLSLRELEAWSGQTTKGDTLLEWMLSGSYPELHAKGVGTAAILSRLRRHLPRTRRAASPASEKPASFSTDSFRLAAAGTGQLLSITSMATSLGVSPNTVKSWLSILEASNIVFLLEPYYRNLGKQTSSRRNSIFLIPAWRLFWPAFAPSTTCGKAGMLGTFFETPCSAK